MRSGISQMQVLYHAEEDRILFRVNSTDKKEFRFWVTRRFSILLLKVLKDHMDLDPDVSVQETPDAKQAVKEFKQEKAIQEANFEQKFNEESKELPLGDEIPLAFKLTYKILNENLQLCVEPKIGPGMNMVLNRQINSSLVQLIKSAAGKANWNLGSPGLSLDQREKRVVN